MPVSEQDVQVGMMAPDFELPEASEVNVRLAEELKASPILLLFYPNDFGVICSLVMRTFMEHCPELRSHGIRVLGISRNSPYTHRAWKENLGLPFRLLSDQDGVVTMQYGGLQEEGLLAGMCRRAVFIIDRKGVIRYAWVSHQEGVPPPFGEVFATLENADL